MFAPSIGVSALGCFNLHVEGLIQFWSDPSVHMVGGTDSAWEYLPTVEEKGSAGSLSIIVTLNLANLL